MMNCILDWGKIQKNVPDEAIGRKRNRHRNRQRENALEGILKEIKSQAKKHVDEILQEVKEDMTSKWDLPENEWCWVCSGIGETFVKNDGENWHVKRVSGSGYEETQTYESLEYAARDNEFGNIVELDKIEKEIFDSIIKNVIVELQKILNPENY
jgi:hypothetical protein